MKTNNIGTIDCLKGHEFTDNLKQKLGCRTLAELAQRLDIPKATLSTWNLKERTSYESIIRIHLATGIPVAELALGIEKAVPSSVNPPHELIVEESGPDYCIENSRLHRIIQIPAYSLLNGEMVDNGTAPYFQYRIEKLTDHVRKLIELELNEQYYLIDRQVTRAISGRYLLNIDGLLSVNPVQRLPGKLLIEFGHKPIEVTEDDIEILGKVVLVIQSI